MRNERICLFGGSFDPVHTGHLLIADAAVRQCRLSKVVFVPARRSPHKPTREYAGREHRLAMVRSAVRGHRRFAVSTAEVHADGLSYTVDTVRVFRREHPKARLFLLIGSDQLEVFGSWKAPREIARTATIIVYTRWGHSVRSRDLRRWGAVRLKGPEIFISSTAIRERCVAGRTIRYLVPSGVERYIRRNGLYSRKRTRT